jgi:hypothetical protein
MMCKITHNIRLLKWSGLKNGSPHTVKCPSAHNSSKTGIGTFMNINICCTTICTSQYNNTHFEPFHSVHPYSKLPLFVFRPNAHNMNTRTFIYYKLPPTYYGFCYSNFRETIALLYKKNYKLFTMLLHTLRCKI